MTKNEILEAFLEMSKTSIPKRDEFVKELGIGKNTIQKYFGSYNQLKDEIIARLDSFTPKLTEPAGFNDDFNEDEHAANYPTSAETLEELIQVCNIDTSQWTPVKINAGSANNKNSIRAEFKRCSEVSEQDLLSHFIEQAAKHSPPPRLFTNQVTSSDLMYFISITDLHFGSVVGDEYDLNIAYNAYIDTVADLIGKVQQYQIQKVVLLVGSDYFHFDNLNSQTTKGTYVEGDSRAAKVFTEGCDLLVHTVEALSEYYEVQLIYIPGNHDRQSSFHLAQYLKAWFRNNSRVTIDAENEPRKYFGWGKTLIGLAHGDGVKHKDLPLLIMRENQETISQYKYMEFFCGHYHQIREQETMGIKVRILSSLAAKDDWHKLNGYIGNIRNSQGFLYSKSDGMMATFYSKPL